MRHLLRKRPRLTRSYAGTLDKATSRWSPTTILLGTIPLFTFGLGVWQLKRLRWKVALIDSLEEKLSKQEMALPRRINPEVIPEFEYRRVKTSGQFDHSREILLGPKTKDGSLGYHLVTPLVREEGSSTILVNRGFIAREKTNQAARPESLVTGTQVVTGMLRAQEPRNRFTTTNSPERNQWTFADIQQMASFTGAEPVLVDEIFQGNAGEANQRLANGVPVGRGTEINLRNMHATYAVTWFSLSAATAVMFVGLLRRKPRSTLPPEAFRRTPVS